MPSFMWVIRDFSLKLEDSHGNVITQKDYLEKALELQKGVSDQVEQKNKVRRLLKMFFKDRDCTTLVRPTEKEKDLQNLNEIDESQLRKEFVEQTKQFRKKILRKVKPKLLNNCIINGRMLVEMSKSYIKSINEGGLPNIESAWTYLC